MNAQDPAHTLSLRNLRITAVDRPELRAVFVADDNGLTMRWISTPSTSGRPQSRDSVPAVVTPATRRDAA